jgi:hypothetical protein
LIMLKSVSKSLQGELAEELPDIKITITRHENNFFELLFDNMYEQCSIDVKICLSTQ